MAKILIVDDSTVEIHWLTNLLKQANHETISAFNGIEGVRLCQQHLPDLVFMDVVMPGLNGFQATRQLKHNPITHHIPIILLTTKDMDTDKAWGLRQGACDYLTKPIDNQILFNCINSVLAKELTY
ncbi:Response regulator PleD [invertebrate metagenome]|uniref:Response regulator PleD n=1 Tax=invertebrate metagenome TaxID=1711999 RepID=A0A2H9T7N7_9ZZZZ